MTYVNLHVHSHYSLLESTLRIPDIVEFGVASGYAALTDTNMHGAVRFYEECVRRDVKPILGCEIELDDGHLLLLAASQTGLNNLRRLVSTPSRSIALLAEYSEGLVATTACLGGHLAQNILRRRGSGEAVLASLVDVYGENLYVELQDHGYAEQKALNDVLIDLSRRLDVPLVATNDCHGRHLELVQAISNKTTIGEPIAYPLARLDESLFPREALENTLTIAAKCGASCTPISKPRLPGDGDAERLRDLARRGLVRLDLARYGRYRNRLEDELDVLEAMGFAGYFEIVADFIGWSKEQGIAVGPGRGSGAGSLTAYTLGITGLDPIRHGLLFERFLNPERVSMPDFDIDFCMDRRDEVIDYVKSRYGINSVAQIATFHEFRSRSVIRDVGRIMDVPLWQANELANLVPEPVNGVVPSLDEAVAAEPSLEGELLENARKIEGLTRHIGVHAAGVVISDGPLWDYVPVSAVDGGWVTHYDKDDVESAGLVKFDFLGLKTLTVIEEAKRLSGVTVTPEDDEATYALLQSGRCNGVFQVESEGMQRLFRRLKPDCFEDVVAAVALYRPGPLGSGMVDDFVDRKHGRKAVEYPHESLRATLESTYGTIVYQEQVMEIAQVMAGYSLGGADLLRRAMGKKKPEEMVRQKTIFVEGATRLGRDASDAERVFDLVAYFAGYGFNKSHSAAYALITYQTAYLKAHYPVEFMCALLTVDSDKPEKTMAHVAEAQALGVTVLPPDVNVSGVDFSVDGDRIRFGLGGIKGVGEKALKALLEGRDRPFTSMVDMALRVTEANKTVMKGLIRSGALDVIHADRGEALASIDENLKQARKYRRQLIKPPKRGVMDRPTYVAAEVYGPMSEEDVLRGEKATIGFYVSGHPTDGHEQIEGAILGSVEGLVRKTTKRGYKMAFFTLESRADRLDVVVRPRQLREFGDVLVEGDVIQAVGRIVEEPERKFLLEEVL